jgi:hypothetical protein
VLELMVVSSDSVEFPSMGFKQFDHFSTAIPLDYDHLLKKITLALATTSVNGKKTGRHCACCRANS